MPFAVSEQGYLPLDRTYHEAWPFKQQGPSLEEPIVPLNMVGQTVPEQDPATGANILQNVQAAIRRGTGNIQLVMSVGPESAIGGRFKAYGKEIREDIKEVLEVNAVKLSSIELPTSISNMSGFDPQRGGFDETRRARDLQEVRDAIRFAADVAGGAGVDVLSWEYDRGFNEAKWNKDKDGKPILGKDGKPMFENPGGKERDVISFVDIVSGKVSAIRRNEPRLLQYDPEKFDPSAPADQWYKAYNDVDPKTRLPKIIEWDWDMFEKVAKRMPEGKRDPALLFIRLHQEEQIMTTEGYAEHYAQQAESMKKRMEDARAQGLPTEVVESFERDWRGEQKLAMGQRQQAENLKRERDKLQPVGEFAIKKSEESYAEAALAAREETHRLQEEGRLRSPIHVGPELGWPTMYGGHPQEFIDLIKGSREEMKKQLIQQGVDPETAAQEAKTHIKGVFDTSHLGMFFQYWETDNPSQEKRIESFNKWFLDQVKMVAEENAKNDILGNVQIVNSMSGAHGHLPPGQGIFPVKEAAEILVKQGKYGGFMTSEGHEEERFGAGRILLDSWSLFDPNIAPASSYGGMPSRWSGVHQNYFGRPYGPSFLVGDIVPSQDFRLWTETPLE